MPLLHLGRNVVALQTVGWFVPFAGRAMVASWKSTWYIAAIVNAEIDFSEDDGSADGVVFAGHSA